MEEFINNNTLTIHDLVVYYRGIHPEYFSDSKVVYEIPLTRELFDRQLELLSTKKMQSEFENFIVGCAERLITPNIKRQTGPDGGGDGKVDAETYEVSPDISDKWYVLDGGASQNEKWAIAISCKKQWKPKVMSDVEKIVGTGRGYTKALFFSNQFIKSSMRADIEKELAEQFAIKVSIFDGLWCSDAVFNHGCKDIALDCLTFSEEYKRKHEIIGPLDQKRKQRLNEIENGILQNIINGLDTGYIEKLQESYIISRELELPRQETEGRFSRALRECEHHGTTQQRFNIIYDHAWTSFFWFEDVDAVYEDYLKLKDFINDYISVARLEKITNILICLINASRSYLFDNEKIQCEISFINDLQDCLQKQDKPSSLLYIRLFITEQTLIDHALTGKSINEDIDTLKPLLLEAANHIDISFETQCRMMEIINKLVDDNPKYEELIDEITEKLRNTKSELIAAQIEMNRALNLMDKSLYKQAVRHFGFCIRPFEKEECMTELIQTSGMMGIALYELGLPYCAEAYLVKSASMLLKDFYESGNIPHLLISVLQTLCKIELMLGRLVMFLNWHELMMVLSQNGRFSEDNSFLETNALYDGGWACRFVASDLNNPLIASLPDILERVGMPLSSTFLKVALGYTNNLDDDAKSYFSHDNWQDKILEQSIFKQFLCDLNISTSEHSRLQTTVNNCTIHIKYNNTCQNQLVAELFLGAIESVMATMDVFEVVTTIQNVYIELIASNDKPTLIQLKVNEYQLAVSDSYENVDLWECIVKFITYYFSNISISKQSFTEMLESKQNKEKIMDRVSDLIHFKNSIYNVLGMPFKNRIEDWKKQTDTTYYCMKKESFKYEPQSYRNDKQQNMTILSINRNMDIWNDAGWQGCGFIFDRYQEYLPTFGLLFENIVRGKQIVTEWQSMSSIIIYIIKGINKQHPSWYRVCISPLIQKEELEENQYVTCLCRKHTMTPVSNWNLDNFEQQFKKFGACRLMAFQIDNKHQISISNDFKEAYKFTNIVFKNAWEIGVHDFEKIALNKNDEPFIPEEEKTTAPIIEVIKELFL